MKQKRSFFAPLLLVVLLAGCATDSHVAHHQDGPRAQGHGSTMDMESMCSMHKQMMAGKTADEQQALMEEHMKSMPSEMRERMQMLHQQCK
jgi:uncharacterized lipoprotein